MLQYFGNKIFAKERSEYKKGYETIKNIKRWRGILFLISKYSSIKFALCLKIGKSCTLLTYVVIVL